MKVLTVSNAPLWEPEVQLLSVTTNSEELIELAYRNCWQSEPKESSKGARRRFIESCMRKGHVSPLEFAEVVFSVLGSRAYSHQQVRHRMASYAQESQRYVKQDDPSRVVIPPRIFSDPAALREFIDAMNDAWRHYAKLLEMGQRKEDARYVLPNACKSMIFVKMNFRTLRHFFQLRLDKAAQWEIREVARSMLVLVHEHAPIVFGDYYRRVVLGEGVPLWHADEG